MGPKRISPQQQHGNNVTAVKLQMPINNPPRFTGPPVVTQLARNFICILI